MALDTQLFLKLNGAIPAWLGFIFLGVTYAGSVYGLSVWLAIIAAMSRSQRWLGLRYVASALVTVAIINQILKHVIGRPRPWRVLAAAHTYGPLEHDFSFPSAHATATFALAVAVALWWPRARWPALVAAVLVSFSRIAIGMHYPGDVLGGAVLGAVTSFCLFPWFARRAEDNSVSKNSTKG